MLRFTRAVASTLVLALVCSGLPSSAEDVPPMRSITLRWKQEGQVKGFRVYVRYFGQSEQSAIDIGLPPAVDGVYSYTIDVSNMEASYITIAAYNRYHVESERSNEKVFLLD